MPIGQAKPVVIFNELYVLFRLWDAVQDRGQGWALESDRY